MRLSIPAYVEQRRTFTVRPLWQPTPSESHRQLERAVVRFSRALRSELKDAGQESRHDELVRLTYSPSLSEQRLRLVIMLRNGTLQGDMLFVTLRELERALAFTPTVPDLWFSVDRGQSLQGRAEEVLTGYLRRLEKEQGRVDPEDYLLQGPAWVLPVDLDYTPPSAPARKTSVSLAMLGAPPVLSGREELERVGRCLDLLYPHELQRALGREQEVGELEQALSQNERRPLLLLGKPRAGKTTVLHEAIRRRHQAGSGKKSRRGEVWLLSPQRLIAGMSYVGQWEQRLLEILAYLKKKRHTLYINDVLGLYLAGISRDSNLSVAQVLKPYIERREISLVLEMSFDELRVLQEQDRGLADLLHQIPVAEPGEEDNLRILIQVMRDLEARHHCRFAAEVIPTVVDVQRRFVRGQAFPGKAACFLEQLAVKHRHRDIARTDVFAELTASSGLSLGFLDGNRRFDRQQVVDDLAARLIGQPAAVAAAADVVSVARARLDDPTRPFGSLLLVGPTGVGKTECAKALAAVLYGDPERLLRFDLNELTEPGSAARLIGTFSQPDGQLTGAVTRQPFSVILLDEVEKAHPEVLDLLLQVLDDGRLSDARGRTTDFGNTIVIMTSNLGAREAGRTVGFPVTPTAPVAVYLRAVEEALRPELFNRIDRVVPFTPLTRTDLAVIARRLIGDVLTREGLVRRKSVLDIHPLALQRVIAGGYHPRLGARALKRTIEHQLVQPVAAHLATIAPGRPAVIQVLPGAEAVVVSVQALSEVETAGRAWSDLGRVEPQRFLGRCQDLLSRLEQFLSQKLPDGGVGSGVDSAGVGELHFHCWELKQQLRDEQEAVTELEQSLTAPRLAYSGITPAPARLVREGYCEHLDMRALFAAEDLHEYLVELSQRALPGGEGLHLELAELRQRLLLLSCVAGVGEDQLEERVLLTVTAVGASTMIASSLAEHYQALLSELGLDATTVPGSDDPAPDHDHDGSFAATRARWALIVQGCRAALLAGPEAGSHLCWRRTGAFELCRVEIRQLAGEDQPQQVLTAVEDQRRQWLQQLAEGRATAESLSPLPPLVRIYDEAGTTLDLGTGAIAANTSDNALPSVEVHRRWLLAHLPDQPELQEAASGE